MNEIRFQFSEILAIESGNFRNAQLKSIFHSSPKPNALNQIKTTADKTKTNATAAAVAAASAVAERRRI